MISSLSFVNPDKRAIKPNTIGVREEEATLRRERELHDTAAKMVAKVQPQMPSVTVPVPTNPLFFPNKPVTTGIVSSSVREL